ncbi:MAG: chromate transporter [Ignavibacteria bacterium RBG_16_35_7]|nr:MAG: chromate transporter [Ignavibacteria bacterium RBG_16_35_7]
MTQTKLKELKEVAILFLKLGLITFGGPAAHIALFEDEVVTKRKWITHQHFLDLVGATNLIPGPNSTEMAIHTGYHRAGVAGLITAGICFTLPAVLITGVFAYIYAVYGNLPDVKPFLYGIKPAVIIVILNAVYRLGSKTIKGWKIIAVGIAVASVNTAGVNEIFSILAGGVFGAVFIYLSEKKNSLNSVSLLSILSFGFLPSLWQAAEKSEASMMTLFLTCLKIGAVWFGSGYVLVAYFDGEFVQGLNWLTRQELLDAIAVGQFTPGPFLSSATFIGYQIAGVPGAIYATVGIIIPSFIFVAILNPLIPKLRKSNFFSKFLDAVNVSALAVMLVVAIKLGGEVLVDWKSWIIALLSVAALFAIKKINAAYIILGGAFLGYIFYLLG